MNPHADHLPHATSDDPKSLDALPPVPDDLSGDGAPDVPWDHATDDAPPLADVTPPTLDPATRTQRIEAAYLEHAAPLVRLARRHTARVGLDDSWADDLVHNVFLHLHRGTRDDVLCRDAIGLARYLYMTVKNGCKSLGRDETTHLRGEVRSGEHAVATTPFPAPESALALSAILTVLDHIVATSTPVQGQAFHLVRVLGYTQAQAAALMGVTVKVVEHSLVRPTLRARRALRHWRETPAPPAPPRPPTAPADEVRA